MQNIRLYQPNTNDANRLYRYQICHLGPIIQTSQLCPVEPRAKVLAKFNRQSKSKAFHNRVPEVGV